MDRPGISVESRDAYERLAGQLTGEAGVKSGKMMGMPTLYAGGKAFAGLFGDAMVFKLDGAAHAAALALPGATLFDPSAMGRPMKAWVKVPLELGSRWPDLAGEALELARAGT